MPGPGHGLSRSDRGTRQILLFPDAFERIFGGEDTRAIVGALEGLSRKEVRSKSPVDIDRLMRERRRKHVAEYPTEEVDYTKSGHTGPLMVRPLRPSASNGKQIKRLLVDGLGAIPNNTAGPESWACH